MAYARQWQDSIGVLFSSQSDRLLCKRETAVKFYFIVDRIALMEQASDEFVARGLVVRNVNSRDDLMKDIRDTTPVVNSEGKAEIMVVNIQKFKEDSTKYI